MDIRLSYLDDFLTPESLAAELRICLKTLERWRVLGQGPKITKPTTSCHFPKFPKVNRLRSTPARISLFSARIVTVPSIKRECPKQ